MENLKILKIRNETVLILSKFGNENWSLKHLSNITGFPQSDILLYFENEQEIIDQSIISALFQLINYLFNNREDEEQELEFYHGMSRVWFRYLKFRQLYSSEENLVQRFFKSPSQFNQARLKGNIFKCLQPFTGFINFYKSDISMSKSLIIFNFLLNAIKHIDDNQDFFGLTDFSSLTTNYEKHFWSKLYTIMDLSIEA